MLGKLLKYDFKSIARILLPIYGAFLVVSVLLGAQSASHSISPAILSIFTALFTVAIILTIVLVIQRFYQNLLGPEGYLMFTIPVSTSTHILEKVLLALVWGLLGSLVIFLASFLILILDPEVGGFNAIFQAMSQLHLTGSDYVTFFSWLLLLILGIAAQITQIYASISVGHLWTSHRILGAFLSYIGFSILTAWVTIAFGDSLFSDWFFSANPSLSSFLPMTIEIAVYGLITWLILDRSLNLD